MIRKKLALFVISIFISGHGFAQELTFDNLHSQSYDKSIVWNTSNYGNGFGHKIYSKDPGNWTLLSIAGRHNSASYTDIMTFTTTGNVGVGTNIPLNKFQVNGAARFITNLTGLQYLLKIGGNTHLSSNAVGISFDPEGYGDAYAGRQKTAIVVEGDGTGWSRGKLHILQNNVADNNPATLSNAAFTIDQSGKIGVGNVNPIAKLDVNGNIRAKEIKVESVNWPDYVFDDDYKIISLTDLEKYIRINKHLPEISSAKEIAKDGLNMGEMQKMLIQKIEEMTLYILEQDKKITTLEKQNERIKALEEKMKKIEAELK
ncbi:hypothetical protein [Pedobacter sp. MW01-1-1]|uniref:hypothetical protein n=1 Tax=Pedobacter sp. MW01-1-1 TaxID=3383027 RepID=UPI003FEF0290